MYTVLSLTVSLPGANCTQVEGEARLSLPSVFDYGLMALAATPIIYLFVNYEYIVNRIFYIDDLTTTDMVMGVIMTLVVLEATRRVIGWALPVTAIVFLI